jgi:hypothetical protein
LSKWLLDGDKQLVSEGNDEYWRSKKQGRIASVAITTFRNSWTVYDRDLPSTPSFEGTVNFSTLRWHAFVDDAGGAAGGG